MANKLVFISRDLAPNSVFKTKLEAKGFKIVDTSLIDFEAVPFGPIPMVDWLFFYSKKGVQYFFEGLQEELLETVQLAAMGPGTASAIADLGHPVSFIGLGDPKTTAALFLRKVTNQKVLFPRANTSKQSIQQLIAPQNEVLDLVVYLNQPKKELHLSFCEILVFTSPLNAITYFNTYPFNKAQQILAIGHTTANTLNQLGISEYSIASEPSEDALAVAISKLNI